MAQINYIPVDDDGEILSSSPLVVLDTKYYELWLQIQGNGNWSQFIYASPLPLFVTSSPAGSTPCIVLSPLPDATTFIFKVRRFNSDNIPSDWVNGTFTTGN